jgi:AcrR family transcriptional regulator
VPRRSAADAARTREDVLSAARDLFTERGYHHVSVPEIAKAAGVTHGALYHHYATKQELFRAVFDRVEHELNDQVIAAALAAPDAWGAFVAGTRTVLTAMANPAYQQVALTDAPSVFGWHEWRTVDSTIGMQTLRAGLGLLQADGFLAGVDLDAFAIVVFGALTESTISLARPGCPVDADRMMAMMCGLVLAFSPGVDAPPTPGASTEG